MANPSITQSPPLHKKEYSRSRYANRAFSLVYACAILALLYHHAISLLRPSSLVSLSISLSLLISDVILAFMWVTAQAFMYRPAKRRVFIEKLNEAMKDRDFPALDVFICTADPYKEPPMSVVNTALSLMAYNYPTNKVSVYVSDDGGSQLTLFAFMEAAKFAREWLPFCRDKGILERSPEAYFYSKHCRCTDAENIKILYESMKRKVESVIERGKVYNEYITTDDEHKAFSKWTDEFTRQNHPTVIQVLLDNEKDRDVRGQVMPNLIYLSRQKSITTPHHFKAGALNTLLRVSATMTNAPIILTQDCDMYSNDPQAPLHVLCYLLDPSIRTTLGYIHFPQRFHGVNKNDIYASELRTLFQLNPMGLDGLAGPTYVGTGCFFLRRVFFGGPSSFIMPELSELSPNHVVDKSIQSEQVLALAQLVASCDYEKQTHWGSKMGFRYGSLVEDYYTGYRLQCEGWKSILCHPERAAFLGDAPITLIDTLNQSKRWAVGLLEVAISKYSPLTFGVRSMGLLMGLAYSHYGFWPILSIPLTIYAFIPQLALLNGISILPKVSDPIFLLYVFLFLGGYGQSFVGFILGKGTTQRWWNDQRMWMIRGISCFLFGSFEYLAKHLGISRLGFSLTPKVIDHQQRKRYDQGMYEFGVKSPMFVPITMAAEINLVSFLVGIKHLINEGDKEGLFLQVCLAGFIVVNSWPIYGAIFFRADKGKMPTKITIISTGLIVALYLIFRLPLKI